MGERSVDVPLRREGRDTALSVRLTIHPYTLDPDDTPAPLLDLRDDPRAEPGVEPVQVLEGREYRYEFLGVSDDHAIRVDRAEVLDADDDTGHRGRFRPQLYTGTLPVRVHAGDEFLGAFAIEVRSRKFDYLRHYRWMLRDLADVMAELVMQRFAASEQRFRIDDTQDAETMYQRFALLKALLEDEHLTGALRQVLHRPHVTWEAHATPRKTRRGVRASSRVTRQLTKPGPRRPLPHGPTRLTTIPEEVTTRRSTPVVDNAPNRFVKFALQRWREMIAHVHALLMDVAEDKRTAPVRRGIAESEALMQRLDAWLHEGLMRRVGRLERFPSNSQVLQKKAGYRAIYRAYIQCEMASQLSWDAQDVYGAGQRDVATLYEYWTFLQLVQIASDLCDVPFDLSRLLSAQQNGLTVGLRHDVSFEGTATANNGRKVRLDVHFNRTFRAGEVAESWSRQMRPDCSLHIRPVSPLDTAREVWLHFDAKYRVAKLKEVFEEDEDGEVYRHITGEAQRASLLKMHAYRDAIHRSAGAYVLYPGDKEHEYHAFHEILPGLGAFPLRPEETGDAGGTSILRTFLRDVLEHLSNHTTQHERARYWSEQAHDTKTVEKAPLPAPFLSRPAADTFVLLGYVRSKEHLDWILDANLYNLRADPQRRGSIGLGARELAADLIILYGEAVPDARLLKVGGEPSVLTGEDLEDSGYPGPGGTQYFVLPCHALDTDAWEEHIRSQDIQQVLKKTLAPGAPTGAPHTTTWLQLLRLLA